MAHHADYLERRDNHALCGAAIEDATTLTQVGGADAICPACEEKLVLYHLEWWRDKALAATAELEALRTKHPEPEESPVRGGAGRIDRCNRPQSRRPFSTMHDENSRHSAGEFDEAVPYFRLKNTMQAFSDRLESDERVLLAQEIGGDGTLIRWSTTEVEALGWHVSNNPVQGELRSDVGRLDSGLLPANEEGQAAIRARPLTTRPGTASVGLMHAQPRFTVTQPDTRRWNP